MSSANTAEPRRTGLIRQKEILEKYVPVSPATWWRWVKSGKAPAAVKLSSGVTAWRVKDVEAMTRGPAA